MSAYLITGPNGSGKSTAGAVLASWGFTAIETDSEPGLSAWVDTTTNKPAPSLPPYPFPRAWLDRHRWLWQRPRMQQIITEHRDQTVFFVGGAYNQHLMYDLFTRWFALYTDNATMTTRLRGRGEGHRWDDGSPELQRALDWNKRAKQISLDAGAILIDSSQDPQLVAQQIIDNCPDARHPEV